MIDEGMLQWFSHVERMENDRIAKRFSCKVCERNSLNVNADKNKDWCVKSL